MPLRYASPDATGSAPFTAGGVNARKLDDIFGELGDINIDRYRASRVPLRTQKLGELAATNRLSSGIAEHSLNALDRDTALGEADIRGATIPQVGTGILQDDSQQFQADESEKEYQRNLALAKLIGGMNKPSTLSEIFGGISSVGQLAGGIGGLASGNPFAAAAIPGAVKNLSGGGSGGGSDLVSMFRNPSGPPNLSLYDQKYPYLKRQTYF